MVHSGLAAGGRPWGGIVAGVWNWVGSIYAQDSFKSEKHFVTKLGKEELNHLVIILGWVSLGVA